MNDIIESCEDLILKHNTMELRESLSSKIEWNPLCMYIAGGGDFVPIEIYQCVSVLDQACDALILLFSNNPGIESCFTRNDRFDIHLNLEVLLSLNVAKYEGNIFYVEPFLIKNGIILKKSMPELSN